MLLSGFSLLILLTTLTFTIYFWQKDQIVSQNTERINSQLEDIMSLLKLQLKEKQLQVSTSLESARFVFNSYGQLEVADESIIFDCVNQITKEVHPFELSKWVLGSTPVHQDFTIVDKIQEVTGQTATIFHKIDQGFLRVSTNVLKLNGERAVGTFIPMESPVIETILNGDTFRGRAFVVDDWYVTAYEPIYVNGEIEGILYVGVKEKDIDYLAEALSKMTLFENGFPYLVNGNGEVIIHPDKVGYSMKDDSLFQKFQDAKSSFVIDKAEDNSTDEDFYHFFDYNPDYDMYVVCSVSSNEFIEDQIASLRNTLLLGCILAVIVLVLILYYSLKNSVVSPLKGIKTILEQMARGSSPNLFHSNRTDELGDIHHSLDRLIESQLRASQFAKQIGSGGDDTSFQPLSEEDILGQALLTMRENVQMVQAELNEAISEATELGNLNTRIDLGDKQGRWRELSIAVNELLESIAGPLMDINGIISELALGNLSLRYEKDAQGDIQTLSINLNTSLNQLSHLLTNISEGIQELSDSSSEMLTVGDEMKTTATEISTAISDVSVGAQSQVSKMDEISNLVHETEQSYDQMEQKANSINSNAKMGATKSELGKEMAVEMENSMDAIFKYSNQTRESIDILTQRSEEITRVLGVITEIASQTNLLALNAAIEAAQAGDAGRGFAVVADEIKKLAENSKESASEIEELVHSVQEDTKKAARDITAMHENVKNGEEASKRSSEVFKEIARASQNTLVDSEGIVSAVGTQRKSIGEFLSKIESVVVISEETAAGAEEIAASSSELSTGMDAYHSSFQRLATIAGELLLDARKFELKEKREEVLV